MAAFKKVSWYVLASFLMAILLGSALASPTFSAFADIGQSSNVLPKNNTPHLPPQNSLSNNNIPPVSSNVLPKNTTPHLPPQNDNPINGPQGPPQNGPPKNSPSVPPHSTLPTSPPGDYTHHKCGKNSTHCFPLQPAKCKKGDILPNGKYRHNCKTDEDFA